MTARPSGRSCKPAQPSPTLHHFAKETPWMTVHVRTARSGTSFSQNMTSSSPIFAEVQRWPFLEAWSRVAPRRGQRALQELSVVTSFGPFCAGIVAASCWLRCQKVLTETRKRNFGYSLGRRAMFVSLLEKYWCSNIQAPSAEENESCSHKLMNSAESDLALWRPEVQSAKP